MKKSIVLLLMLLAKCMFGQTLYDPQVRYDDPGGLFDTDSLRTLDIWFYNPDYDSILQTNWELASGQRLPASVTLSNGTVLDSVAVRYKGNSTFAIAVELNDPKLPLNIDMNDLISGQELMGYKKLKLANSLFDPTFCKEITAYNIYRRYLPSGQANFMDVNVQGKHIGLYVNTQSVDKHFLNQHFDENDGVLFKCDPLQQFGQQGAGGISNLSWLGIDSTAYYDHYMLKSDYGWAQLIDLIHTEYFEQDRLDSVLNIDRILWAFAVNTVLLNLDAYNGYYQHNYYLYQTGDGLFQMIPWDMTETFVGALLGQDPYSNALFEYDPFNGSQSWWQPLCYLFTSDSADASYRKLYTAHVRTVMEESLDEIAVGNYVDYLQNIAVNAVTADTNKVFPMSEFYLNVTDPLIIPNSFATASITSTIALRKTFLESYPEIMLDAPEVSVPSLMSLNGSIHITDEVLNAVEVELMVTISPYSSKFKAFDMHDDGTDGDELANDHIYTAFLPYQDSGQPVKYYIRAENSDAVKLEPQRAEYQFYIYSAATGIAQNRQNEGLSVYPDPFKGTTTFTYTSAGNDPISLRVFDISGREVATLVNGSQSVRIHHQQWTPDNLKSGVYFYEFRQGTERHTGHLVFLK